MSKYFINKLISVYAYSIFINARNGLLTEEGVVDTMNTLVSEVEKVAEVKPLSNTQDNKWKSGEEVGKFSEDNPRTKVKYVKVNKSTITLDELMVELLDGVLFYNGEQCGGHYPSQTVLMKYIEGSESLYRRIETVETLQQCKDRERLEVAYDLHCSITNSTIRKEDFFNGYGLGGLDMWLAIVGKTNYYQGDNNENY